LRHDAASAALRAPPGLEHQRGPQLIGPGTLTGLVLVQHSLHAMCVQQAVAQQDLSVEQIVRPPAQLPATSLRSGRETVFAPVDQLARNVVPK
jgi:hypothetical protein